MECFRPIIIVFVFLLFPPWGWPRGWPKHVSDSCVIKLHSYIQVHLLLFLKKMYITIILLHAKSRHWFWTPLWWGKLSRPSPSLNTLPWRYIRSGSVAPCILTFVLHGGDWLDSYPGHTTATEKPVVSRQVPLASTTAHYLRHVLSVRPSVHLYKRRSYWTDFLEIWHWGTFIKKSA